MNTRTRLVNGVLFGVWAIIVVWQVEEHYRVREAARSALANRARAMATPLRGVIQALGYEVSSARLLEQERLETALKGLITEGDVSAIALLNEAGEIVVAAGAPIDPDTIGQMQTREHWDANSLTVVRRVDLSGIDTPEGETNRPSIPVPGRGSPGPPRDRPRPPGGSGSTNSLSATSTSALDGASTNAPTGGSTNAPGGPGENRPRRRGPPLGGWPWMTPEERQSMVEKRGLHGLVVVMPTQSVNDTCNRDLWLRALISFLGAVSVAGFGLAWRNQVTSAELEVRLVRASELNARLKETNLAAAGLAHETRNPLNIVRGLAQMISKQETASPEVRQKSREIIDEADRVTAQLNDFINFSKPREVRRSPVALNSVVAEVVRALGSDLEEKCVRLDAAPGLPAIEADEQLLRQALFNLLINAIQAVERGGEIQVAAGKTGGNGAWLEIRDNGPGVPPENRSDVFKPYFTTHAGGTGLGLAVVHQIVLAHGWEIACLPNEPKGAVFRITHLKLVA
jgi:signal transduction histidine kinase